MAAQRHPSSIPIGGQDPGERTYATFLLLADLGEADANVSHIWRNHLAFVEDRLNASVSESNDTWIKRFLAGAFVGGGWTEANNVTLANLVTTVTPEDDHWVVTGAKYYATGSLYADWLDVLGRDDDGEFLTALVGADDPGVSLVDDWRGFGQRTTASGSARYDRARADRQTAVDRRRGRGDTGATGDHRGRAAGDDNRLRCAWRIGGVRGAIAGPPLAQRPNTGVAQPACI
ncbi:MAG: Acyl-CoA dehydrogenase [Mycobacterium sp.]|nr:Acyl-CoA dehydrogenase [Mycobacterium sp.]